jgi:MarR family transcriptional regulator, organic hydroperoxide resistance regulator
MHPKNDVPFGFSSPYHSPGFLLWRVSGAWQRRIRDALLELDLTHAQFVFLAVLAWNLECTQVELAQIIGADVMTTSSLARSLEQRGLLTRTTAKNDARAKVLRLSPSGVALVQQAVPLVEKSDLEFFNALEQQGVFVAELQRLIGKP